MDKVLNVAEYVITKTYKTGNPVTNLKLQKILYFLYCDYYKKYKKELFKAEFVAWKLGPVVPDVYYAYCINISDPLKYIYNSSLNLCDEEMDFINKRILELSSMSNWTLIEMSKATSSWSETYNDGKGRGNVISKEMLKGETNRAFAKKQVNMKSTS